MRQIIIMSEEEAQEFFDFVNDFEFTEPEGYCMQIKPFKCGCGKMVCYAVTGPHLIIVWPTKDDTAMHEFFSILVEGNYDPHVVPYHEMFGEAIMYQDARTIDMLQGIHSDES